jgi:DNA-binding protein HU-beta
MNKSELVDAIAAKADLSKAASGKALEAMLDTIVQAVAKDDTVSLVGFGSFKPAPRAAREGRNPQNPDTKIKIPATVVPRFSAGAPFKKAVADGHKPTKKRK